MAKYAGLVGYASLIEDPPGVWNDVITERMMRGDVIRASARFVTGLSTNENVNLGNRISLLGDPYAFENFTGLRYVMYLGSKWKITSVEIERPRLIVTLGAIYTQDDPWSDRPNG